MCSANADEKLIENKRYPVWAHWFLDLLFVLMWERQWERMDTKKKKIRNQNNVVNDWI